MAEVQRRRTLINPAKRKRRHRRNRKMSAKQIAIFGSKRQKAALKASRKRKRRNAARKHSRKRTVPRKRRHSAPRANRSTRRRRARRRNPGGIVEVALNPAPKRRKTVARTRKRKRNRSHSRRRAYRRQNPAPVRHHRRRRRSNARRHHRRHARRNPSMGGVSNLIVSAAYAIGGAVGSKYLTQMVLGASNVGYVGYAANLAAAFVGGKVVGMLIKNKQAENSVILGGVIMTLIRFLSDQTPIGATLQQYGLGDYEASTWLTPARYVNAAQSAQVDIPTALRPQLVSAKAGMAGMGGGSYSRSRGTY